MRTGTCLLKCVQSNLVEFTDVSELFTASTIRAIIEVVKVSEMTVSFHQTTGSNNAEDRHLHLIDFIKEN
jgi:hypothetical protein